MQISNYFADKLLRIVSDILHHFKGKGKSESVELTNREPDPHTHKGDAALEFIKHICAVLALDQNVQHDILVIRLLIHCELMVTAFTVELVSKNIIFSFTDLLNEDPLFKIYVVVLWNCMYIFSHPYFYLFKNRSFLCLDF